MSANDELQAHTCEKMLEFYGKDNNVPNKTTNYDILKEYEAHKTPVPSYEEYNRLKEVERKKGKLVNVNYKIKQENQRLKELLKECKETIETSVWGNCSELTDQIDEVLK